MALSSNKRRPGTANGKQRDIPNQGQPRGGNFIGNLQKVQQAPWSESVRITNKTIPTRHPDNRNDRTII